MKKVTANYGSTEPTAFVTKGRQRVKQYNDSSVYLNNRDEFELELFNPTTSKVMAKIELNGISIGAGIVLRPGERVFIERYLEEARKFMFQTYEVNGNNKEVQKAIANNGDVRVLFYKEETPYYPWYSGGCTWTTQYPTWGCNTFTSGDIGTPTFGGSDLTGALNDLSMYSSNITDYKSENMACCDGALDFMPQAMSREILCDSAQPKSRSKQMKSSMGRKLSKSAKPTETGRIDKGSASSQSFGHDYSSFETYYTWQTKWKILPLSQKAVASEDLKTFCTNCGARKKRGSHKFCPNCGTKY